MLLELEQELHKMSLEHLVTPRSKDLLKKKTKHLTDGGMERDRRANGHSAQWPKPKATGAK